MDDLNQPEPNPSRTDFDLEALRTRARRLFEDKPARLTELEPDPQIVEQVNRMVEKLEADPLFQKHREAERKAQSGDWSGAEQAYRDAIALAHSEQAASQEHAHLVLSEFLLLIGRPAEAVESARRATELIRSWDCAPLLRRALEGLVRAALAAGDVKTAKAAVAESLALADVTHGNKLMSARAHVQRARCHLLENDLVSANADLQAAWPALAENSREHALAGYQSGLANWWETNAEVHRRKGDLPGAIEAMQESLKRRQIVTELPQISGPAKDATLAQSLHAMARLLVEAGRDKLAGSFFAQSEGVRNAVHLAPLPRGH